MNIIKSVMYLGMGLILAGKDMFNTQAATTGSAANIGSFAGAGSINDLIPLVYISSILLLGVSLFALGGAGMAGFGPLGNR